MNPSTTLAHAAIRYGSKSNNLDQQKDFIDTANAVLQKPDVLGFIEHPLVPRPEKIDLLTQASGADPRQAAWLRLVLEAKMAKRFDSVHSAFIAEYNKTNGNTQVEVISRSVLTQEQKNKVQTGLNSKLKGKVLVCYTVDKRMLGGIIIRYEKKEIDLSFNRIINQLSASER